MTKKILTNIIFWLHFPIVIIYFGLFFIPKSLWKDNITFHFWYVMIIFLIQIIWGTVIYPKTKKIEIICPLTTLMQRLRGYEIENERNYNHSFTSELLEKLKIKLKYNIVSVIIMFSILIVVIQYFFFN